MVEVRVQEPSSTTSSTSSSTNSRANPGPPNTGVHLGPQETPQDTQGVIEGSSSVAAKPIHSKERIFTRENSVTSSPGTQHTAVMFIIAALNKILGDK